MMTEFPSVFSDDVVRMEDENFYISLAANAKPFCVNTPCTVPYAYRDSLSSKLYNPRGSLTQ